MVKQQIIHFSPEFPEIMFPFTWEIGKWVVVGRMVLDGCLHLAVLPTDVPRPSFNELMAIKNKIAGDDAYAIEVYPPMRELVNMDEGSGSATHLWVLPNPLPYNLLNRGDNAV